MSPRPRVKRPIHADETIWMAWLVVKVSPNPTLNAEVVECRGRTRGEDHQTALGAKGRVLLTGHLSRIARMLPSIAPIRRATTGARNDR